MLKNPAWPLYATTSTDATYAYTKMHTKGAGCVRNGFVWTFPQSTASSTTSAAPTPKAVIAQAASGRTFYATSDAMLGGSNAADGAAPSATNTVACCEGTGLTNSNCLTASFADTGSSNTDTFIGGPKMLWGQPSTAISTTSWKAPGVSATGAVTNVPRVHTDLAVASTNQLSWDGVTGTRANAVNDYCDKQYHTATAATETYTFRTINGLSGSTKCTYMFMAAAGIGAPAFKLVKADWMLFQLHFFEWATDTTIKQIGATSVTPGFYGAYPTHWYPSPIMDSGVPKATTPRPYPAAGATDIGWAAPTCGPAAATEA